MPLLATPPGRAAVVTTTPEEFQRGEAVLESLIVQNTRLAATYEALAPEIDPRAASLVEHTRERAELLRAEAVALRQLLALARRAYAAEQTLAAIADDAEAFKRITDEFADRTP